MSTSFYSRQYFNSLKDSALRKIAENYGVKDIDSLTREELVDRIYGMIKVEQTNDERKSQVSSDADGTRPKTQEEEDEDYREQFRVNEERDDGIVRYNPFVPVDQPDPKKLRAVFEDTPLHPFRPVSEIQEEIQERLDNMIPVIADDGRTIYLSDTPQNSNNTRSDMKAKTENAEKSVSEKSETIKETKPKRTYTRRKIDANGITDEVIDKAEEFLPEYKETEEEYRDVFVGGAEREKEDPIKSDDGSQIDGERKRPQNGGSFNKPVKNGEDGYKSKRRGYNGSQGDGTGFSRDKENEEDLDSAPLEYKEGVLEIMADGYGFLRAKNYESGEHDAYVSAQRIRRSGLRKGDYVKAEAKQICENRPAGVINVLEVNGCPPESAFHRKNFDALTPIYPDQRYRLEIPGKSTDFAIRCIDLVAPIGKGQRSMIVSPPKAGKTTLLKAIARSISINYPDAHLMVLLVDERPEEVTDMQRSINGEVIFSTFDEMPEHHTKAAELVLERAKRLVEMDKDVVILMDSLTRLARAYNLTISPTGRTLSGGIDPGALHSPKRFFGAARNIENGGSLTIIATALVDTGSRMDDVIYEEFKGTGNMEIHLDRRLSERRIFPAIDLYRSGTRRDEMLLDQDEIGGIWGVRKMLSAGGDTSDSTETLINMMIKTKTNKEFIEQLNFQLKKMKDNGYIT